jgi:hypothetical protein
MLIGLLLLTRSVSFAQIPYYTSETDIQRISYNPPLSEFSFAKKKIVDMTNASMSKIDTSSVYFVKDDPFLTEQEDSGYGMYRFYPNGLVFIASALDVRIAQLDTALLDTTYGNWGLYKIEGNTLTIQGWFKNIYPHFYRCIFRILTNKDLILIKTAGGKLGLSRHVRIKIPAIRKHYIYGELDIWHEQK